MNPDSTLMQQPLDALLAWYSSLQADTVKLTEQFYAAEARFKDPFNDVQGVANVAAIFQHMFATTQHPRFIINERILQHQQAFVTWTFEFELQGRAYQIVGGSHLVFNAAGLVILHRDYWDAAEELYEKLPWIGSLMRWLKRRINS